MLKPRPEQVMIDQMSQPLTPLDPQQVGDWIVDARIGSGGMGVVYRTHRGEQEAAVKVVRPGLLDDPAVVARFAREADVLRRVRDVHISQFLDADLTGDPAYLATEYISGPNLRAAVEQDGPLSPADWWTLAKGLAQALAVLEVHGITHRDIKPANVILNDRGPVLIDFGIAHAEHATSVTATGLVTGSPAWLSPEQADMAEAGAAGDVFSLGSLLAYAATGRPPFGNGPAVVVLTNIKSGDPDLVGIDADRSELLRGMLQKDPARRPAIREVLDIARQRVMGETTQPMRPAPAQGLDATAAFPPVQAPVGVPASAPPPVPPQAGWPPPAQPFPPVPAPQRGSRSSWGLRIGLTLLGFVLAAVLGYVAVQMVGGLGDSGGSQGNSSSGRPSGDQKAPTSNQLNSGSWLLSRYAISNDGGTLVVEGTLQNRGDEVASTEATVTLFSGGQQVAQATGSAVDVPPGESVQVTFTSDDPWVPGQPIVALSTS